MTEGGNAEARLERVKPALCCPECGGDLSFAPAEARCGGCNSGYPIRNSRIYFTTPAEDGDALDSLKGRLRRLLGRHYRLVADIVAPNFFYPLGRRVRRQFRLDEELVIDLGSGSQRLDEAIICVDSADYGTVDVVCDIQRLPFKADSIDGAISVHVLEHVADPFAVADHLARCTKPGGHGLHAVPFLYPFHAAPNDYLRFTAQGLGALFRGWEMIEVTNTSGPISYFLLGLAEMLSVLLGLGSERLRAVVYLAACLVLFPFKLLDILFINRPGFMGMAPTLLAVVRKPLP